MTTPDGRRMRDAINRYILEEMRAAGIPEDTISQWMAFTPRWQGEPARERQIRYTVAQAQDRWTRSWLRVFSGQPFMWSAGPPVADSPVADSPDRGSYARLATAPPREAAPEADVDDLTATIEGRCACPCRQPIGPGSPSAWFATQACQHAWNSARCTDPYDVYQRPDAAPYPWCDTARPQLTAPASAHTGLVLDGPALDGQPWWRTVAGIVAVLAYRRVCLTCSALNICTTSGDLTNLHHLRDGDRVTLTSTHLPPCGGCGRDWATPQPTARVEVDIPPRRVRLSLGCDTEPGGLVVTELVNHEDPDLLYEKATSAWRRMAATLAETRHSR